jgi:hypothetical protein
MVFSGRLFSKRYFVPTIALGVSLFAFLAVILAGGAAAASVNADATGNGVPLPPPTVPATLPVPSTTVTSVPVTPTVPGPQPTAPGCQVTFSDVQPADWFYEPVRWMFCNGIVSGYPDNTFRPYNSTTRGQILKIAVRAFNLPLHTDGGPHFSDVPVTHTFYPYIETASFHSIVGGYACGGDGEPCDGENRPYFRPNSLVTRGQLTKITVLTAIESDPVRWQLLNPAVASFVDVPLNNAFFPYVETAVAHNILQGYSCGGSGEPCPGRYFRPGNDATRAQLSKIVMTAVTAP